MGSYQEPKQPTIPAYMVHSLSASQLMCLHVWGSDAGDEFGKFISQTAIVETSFRGAGQQSQDIPFPCLQDHRRLGDWLEQSAHLFRELPNELTAEIWFLSTLVAVVALRPPRDPQWN